MFIYHLKIIVLYINVYILNKTNIITPTFNKELFFSKFILIYNSVNAFLISIVVYILFLSILESLQKLIFFTFNKDIVFFHFQIILYIILLILTFVFYFIYKKDSLIYFEYYNVSDYTDYTNKLLNKCIDENNHLTYNQFNMEIRKKNLIILQNYLEEIDLYYKSEKDKILSPKEIKEIEYFFNFKEI